MNLREGLEYLTGKLSAPNEYIGEYKGKLVHKDVKVIDLEEYEDLPRRIREDRNFANVEGFAEYLKDYAGKFTKLFANPHNRMVTAIIDYHSYDSNEYVPSFCSHRAGITFNLDDDFQAWLDINGKTLDQRQLVNFLVDYADDFIDPVKAEVLEVVGNIKAAKTKNIDSSAGHYDLDKVVNSSTKIKSGKGELPELFKLALPVLEDFDKYQVSFRIAVKVEYDDIGFCINLIRPHNIIKAAFNDACGDIVEKSGKSIYGFEAEKETKVEA